MPCSGGAAGHVLICYLLEVHRPVHDMVVYRCYGGPHPIPPHKCENQLENHCSSILRDSCGLSHCTLTELPGSSPISKKHATKLDWSRPVVCFLLPGSHLAVKSPPQTLPAFGRLNFLALLSQLFQISAVCRPYRPHRPKPNFGSLVLAQLCRSCKPDSVRSDANLWRTQLPVHLFRTLCLRELRCQ